MLVVLLLLPLSSPVYDGEFDHGGGGGGCGGQTAAAVAAVEVVEDNLSAKAAGNESVDGRMTACDDEIGRRTTTQQPTNEWQVRTTTMATATARWAAAQRDTMTMAMAMGDDDDDGECDDVDDDDDEDDGHSATGDGIRR